MHKTLHPKPRKKSTLLISLSFFMLLGGFIYFIPPETYISVIGFFIVSFIAVGYFFTFIFNNRRRAFSISCALVMILLLRMMELRHWVYPLLIGALLICIEMYFEKNRSENSPHTTE